MIEATPADLLGRCIRGADKPLASFLSDALSRCIGANYVVVVNRVLGRDGQNQRTPNLPVESLLELDLPALLQLFDNCIFLHTGTDRNRASEWKEEFRSLFKIPKGSESNHFYAKAIGVEIAAVRAARNDLSHRVAGKEVTVLEVKSDLHKIIDLLGSRCLSVAHSHTDVFTADTRDVLSAYIAEVEACLIELDRESVQRALERERSEHQRMKADAERGRTRVIRSGLVVAGLIAVAVVALALGGVFTPTPRNSVGVVLLDTVPSDRLDQVVGLIQNHVGSVERIQIAYLKANGRDVTKIDVDNEPGSLRAATKSLNDPGPIADRFEYRTRFDALYTHLQSAVSQDQAPTLLILGSIGNFTKEERDKLMSGKVDLYPQKGMSAWWVSNRVAPPTFIYWSEPTRSDSALFVNFPDKSGEMKPVVVVLR